jgi:hypothetical protein
MAAGPAHLKYDPQRLNPFGATAPFFAAVFIFGKSPRWSTDKQPERGGVLAGAIPDQTDAPDTERRDQARAETCGWLGGNASLEFSHTILIEFTFNMENINQGRTGAVGRGSARAGASRLASPRRMIQTETLRFRLAAAIVTADKQIGPCPRFPNAAGAHVLSLATPKLVTSQIAAVHLWVQAFWSKRPGSPGSGGASPYRAWVNKNADIPAVSGTEH